MTHGSGDLPVERDETSHGSSVTVDWFVPLIPRLLSAGTLGRLLPDRTATAQLLGVKPDHERLHVRLPWLGAHGGPDVQLVYQGGDVAVLSLSWVDLHTDLHPLDLLLDQIRRLRERGDHLQITAFGVAWEPLLVPSGSASMVEGTVLVCAERTSFGRRRHDDLRALTGSEPAPTMESLDSGVAVDIGAHEGSQSLISFDARHLVLNVEESLGFHGSQGVDSARVEAVAWFPELLARRAVRTWEAWHAAAALDALQDPDDAARSAAIHDLRELRRRRGLRRFAAGLSARVWHEGSASDGAALQHLLQEHMDRDLARVDGALDELSQALEDAEQSTSTSLTASLAQSADRAQARLRPVAIAFALLALASLWVGISAIPAGEGAFWPSVPRALSLLIVLAVVVGVLAFAVDKVANRRSPERGKGLLLGAAGLCAALAAGLGVWNILSESSSAWILAAAIALAAVSSGLIAYGWHEGGAGTDTDAWTRPEPAANPDRGESSRDKRAIQALKDLQMLELQGSTSEINAGRVERAASDDHPGRVTTQDGQEAFHRLIREYKQAVTRRPDQSSADYQEDAEAAARAGLRAELEKLSRERTAAAGDTSSGLAD